MKKFILISLLFFWPMMILAATDIYHFANSEEQARFQQLTAELRCLVCQNQSLADSHAPLAEDLRSEVAELIQQGKSNQEVVAYLINRYGDFVLYKPALSPMTWMLWFGPFLLLLLSIVILFIIIKKRKQRAVANDLTPTEQQDLQQLLNSANEKTQ